VEADLLIESSPVKLQADNPCLTLLNNAVQAGWNVVLANKAPLVLEYDKLMNMAKENNAKVRFSATVCGGLPVINVLQRDLKFATPERLWGIFNATSNYVLHEMEKGVAMEEAVKVAQEVGAAETDPMLDLSGQDTANKLFVVMKSFTDFDGDIDDIEIEGIQKITHEEIQKSTEANTRIKLVAAAHKKNDKWKLSVKPTRVAHDSFMGSCKGWEMGIEIKTDLYESISMKNAEADPKGTCAAVLRDMIDISMDI
jgi:homoserine dehydrogenase